MRTQKILTLFFAPATQSTFTVLHSVMHCSVHTSCCFYSCKSKTKSIIKLNDSVTMGPVLRVDCYNPFFFPLNTHSYNCQPSNLCTKPQQNPNRKASQSYHGHVWLPVNVSNVVLGAACKEVHNALQSTIKTFIVHVLRFRMKTHNKTFLIFFKSYLS